MSHSPKILLDVSPSAGLSKDGPKCPGCKKPFGKNRYDNPQFIKRVKENYPGKEFKDEELETCFNCLMLWNFQHMGKMALDIINVRVEK